MTTPPPVIAAPTLYCPRCMQECALSEFVALMRDVRAGAKARRLPMLTIWKHKPEGKTRKRSDDYVSPCGQLVYALDVIRP